MNPTAVPDRARRNLRLLGIRAILAGLITWGLWPVAWAQDAQTQGGAAPGTGTGGVDTAHEAVSSAVVTTAEWLDTFFGSEEADAESNRTRLRVKLGGFVEAAGGFKDTVKVRGNLALPKTGKRLNVIIGGEGDEDSALENTSADDVRERVTETDKENVGLGLQYFLHRSNSTNLSATAGMRVKTTKAPIGVFGARYRYSLPLDGWTARYIQRVQWLTEDELIVPSQFDFERPLPGDVLFKTTFAGTWIDSEETYFYAAGAVLRQIIDTRKAVSYEWNNQFQTEPNNRFEETVLRVRYRQAVWRQWLRFDLVPQLSFPRERGFRATPGIYAGFEVSFGG